MMRSAAPGREFWKLTAAGNDFIVLDAASAPGSGALEEFVRRVCRRRVSVGADGVILVRDLGPDRLRVAFYNPDGTETFCGNGARCAARYGVLRGGTGPRVVLETVRGPLRAEVSGSGVRVEVGPCRVLRAGLWVPWDPGPIRADLIDVGVPHLVTFDLDPSGTDIEAWGPVLRSHPQSGPEGANVDFCRSEGAGVVSIRTFERGVEGETLACGTGCVAAALAADLRGFGQSPTLCRTRSGSPIEVEYVRSEDGYSGVTLAGEARLVFRAELGPEP